MSFGEGFDDLAHGSGRNLAGDVRYSGLEADPTIDIYLPQGLFPQAAITLIARTRTDVLSAAPSVRERVYAVDPHSFVTDIHSMDQLIAGSQAQRRASTPLCFDIWLDGLGVGSGRRL